MKRMQVYIKILKILRVIENYVYFQTRKVRSSISLLHKLKNISVKPLTLDQKSKIDMVWRKGGHRGVFRGNKFDYKWFVFYNSLKSAYPIEQFIPNDLFYTKIEPYYNIYQSSKWLDDKNLYDCYFPLVSKPRTVARIIEKCLMDDTYCPISKDEFLKRCIVCGKVVFKQAVESDGGKGIAFWNKDTDDVALLDKLIHEYRNAIVQEIIEQSQSIAKFHPNSINTIRIMTLMRNSQVKIVSSVLRIGRDGAKIDNVSSGGIAVGITSEGTLRKYAYDVNGSVYDKHPTTKVLFFGEKIPNFDKCCDVCKRLAPVLSRTSKMISWDLALNSVNEPILIEANLVYGQLDFHQMCNGPLFGSEFMEILSEVGFM